MQGIRNYSVSWQKAKDIKYLMYLSESGPQETYYIDPTTQRIILLLGKFSFIFSNKKKFWWRSSRNLVDCFHLGILWLVSYGAKWNPSLGIYDRVLMKSISNRKGFVIEMLLRINNYLPAYIYGHMNIPTHISVIFAICLGRLVQIKL